MEEKETIPEKKKSNKGLIIIIIILVVALLGALAYIGYDKGIIFQKKDSNTTKEESSKKDNNKLSQEDLDRINDITKEISNDFAMYYPINDLSKIDNQDLLLFALKKIGWNEEITTKQIENQIKDYFGTSVKVKHEDIECPSNEHDEPLYLYEDGVYKPNEDHGGHGGPGSIYTELFNISSEKNNNTITVSYKMLYSNSCSDTCIIDKYYKSYEDSINDENAVLTGNEDSEDNPGINLTEDLYKTVEKELPVTTFIFEKDSNGFNLKEVKIK